MKTPDKLDEFFRLQKEPNQRIGVDTDQMTDVERQQWVLNYCRAMSQEVAELTDCVPWKWWAIFPRAWWWAHSGPRLARQSRSPTVAHCS